MNEDDFADTLMENYGYCRKIVWNFFRDNDVVDDVIQDSFLAAWRNRNKLDSEKFYSIRPWLKTIVVSYCYTHVRYWSQEMRDASKSEPFPDFDIEDRGCISPYRHAVGRIDLEQVFEIVKDFPDFQVEIFHLRWIEDKTLQEISDVMGIPYKGMAQKIQDIRRKIKRRLCE